MGLGLGEGGVVAAVAADDRAAGAAAAGIAQINAIGNIGGFLGTYLLGVIKDATGSYPLGLLPLAILSAAGCALVLGLGSQAAVAVDDAAFIETSFPGFAALMNGLAGNGGPGGPIGPA